MSERFFGLLQEEKKTAELLLNLTFGGNQTPSLLVGILKAASGGGLQQNKQGNWLGVKK